LAGKPVPATTRTAFSGQFAPANAKFVSDYQNARIIVDAAAGHASPNQPTPAPTPATSKP
jgi:hypothetical protein